MISIEQISCFTAVYELGSFSAASKKLGKARSTVRERINSLEDMMAMTLFTIEGKQALPTDIAHRLYPRSRLLARQSLEFENIVLSAYKGELSNITAYHDSSIPITLLLNIEAEIKAQYPDVTLNWLQRDRYHCLNEVENGDVLFAIMPGLGNLHPNTGIGNINLGTYRLGVYTAADSSIPDIPISLSEIASKRQLVAENDVNNALRHTKLSSEIEIVASRSLLMEKLKLGGWTVLPVDDMKRLNRHREFRAVYLVEVPSLLKQDCILFYNLSSEASVQESNILKLISHVCKDMDI
ncbi:putative Transcriptional regulator, LysR family protein [Vibrio nigripulchritudo SFn27]|uniref:Putative Transcriptional regulator, LysR family protein n=1 Tax=Vibrio nigripulchritudo TaxID=28173 RepID=U4KG73_9VIBR|nr:LysR family transcriptional regulator [Vibrio nigripulchritudo]CCN85839.1 putative Transcriptional regulator, LysR family protein [Vibrio nigripulchritudo BLFn1]CCN90510.1 putative Transcriptional regulator, LysR family protein [Vibrio nigripulchritudo SFn27]CCN93629.1 putative Transcriptional regulator, LysR family protein [Vibrio nigripulchritudo ENn2]CCO42951.1 putative Transcriptional regulator, LysR family protein [Vibrio nigripulchritudo SFn135]CCO50744.1 putative Transcriptional regu